jgi:RimJ/RimL family protein N-acetyltransferase
MSLAQMPVVLNGKPKDVDCGTVSLRGVTRDDIPLLWKWLNEYPRANFDDGGPQMIEEFEVEMGRRFQRGEICMGALHNGKLVGCIGYAPVTHRLGSLHGICFSKDVHGTGVAAFAVKNFLKMLFTGKVEKVFATYFQDNTRIKKFLRKQGFVHEGTLIDHTVRGGRVTTMSLVALHKKNFTEAM